MPNLVLNSVSVQSTLGDTDALFRACDYLSGLVRTDGAFREAFDSGLYWGNLGMSLVVLTLASGHLHPQYKASSKNALLWLATNVSSTGVWAQEYTRDPSGAYNPVTLTGPYRAFQSQDLMQTLPIAALAMYNALFQDYVFVCQQADQLLFGLNTFLSSNFDPTSNLYAARLVQSIPGGPWVQDATFTTTGQVATYLGLMGAYSLTGDKRYQTLASNLQQTIYAKLWSPALGLYATSFSDPTTVDLEANAMLLWVFGQALPHASAVAATVSAWLVGSTTVVPGSSVSVAENTAWTGIIFQMTSSHPELVAGRNAYLKGLQMDDYPNPLYGDGAVQPTPGSAPAKLSSAFVLMMLSESPVVLWWR